MEATYPDLRLRRGQYSVSIDQVLQEFVGELS